MSLDWSNSVKVAGERVALEVTRMSENAIPRVVIQCDPVKGIGGGTLNIHEAAARSLRDVLNAMFPVGR